MSPAEIKRVVTEIRMLVAMRTRREIATELNLTYSQVKGICERRGIEVQFNGNGDRAAGQHAFARECKSRAVSEWPAGLNYADDVRTIAFGRAPMQPATHVPTIAGPPTGSRE